MAEKHPIATKNEHDTNIKGGRVVYRRMETFVKCAEFVLDLPDFLLNLRVSQINKIMGSLDPPNSSPVIIQTPPCADNSIVESEFNKNEIFGKIILTENESEYCVEYEVRFLRTDEIACCTFGLEVKAFLCRGDKDPVLLASESAFGPGNADLSVRGRQMRIPCTKMLDEAVMEKNTTLRVVLNVHVAIYKQPKTHSSFGTCDVCEQCDLPFLKPLQNGEGSDVQLMCEDKTFPVHAFIVKTISQVFRTMLEVPMKEAATREIVIQDLSVDTVERMVDYMYHGRIDVGSNAEVVELLYAAEKYEFDLLKTACLERMVTSMSDENITLFLEISVRVNAGSGAIKQMVDYCMDRIKELKKQKNFQDFARANPNLFLESWLSN